MKALGMARYMQKNVPGMDVPDEVIKRLQGAGKGNAATEGIKFCVEQIQELRESGGTREEFRAILTPEQRAELESLRSDLASRESDLAERIATYNSDCERYEAERKAEKERERAERKAQREERDRRRAEERARRARKRDL